MGAHCRTDACLCLHGWNVMNYRLLIVLLLLGSGLAGPLATAHETLTPEPTDSSYHFTTHYRVQIHAPAHIVWLVMIDLKSWMYEFELTTESGEPGVPGQVLKLYPAQEFRLQVIAAEPHQMLTLANLPLTFQGEFGPGVGIFTLHEHGGITEVSLTGSGRYSWQSEDPNPLQSRRASAEFQEQTRATWNRFLQRLKVLSEQANK